MILISALDGEVHNRAKRMGSAKLQEAKLIFCFFFAATAISCHSTTETNSISTSGGSSMTDPATTRQLGLPAQLLRDDAGLSTATIIAFTEGPAADKAGNVYFSDILNSRFMKLSADGGLSVFRADSGRTNGNAFDQQGRLISCEGSEMGSGGRRRIVQTDLKSGQVTVLTESYQGARYNSPNDLTIDNQGRIYFTDPCYGERSMMEMEIEGVYRIDLGGAVTRIL
jgi:hypothetical protein